MPSADDVAASVERFVRGRFGVDPGDARLARSTDLFEEGWIDSVGLTELLAFVEREFGVAVPDEALLSDAFASIDGVAAVVAELAGGRAEAERS
ncbi:MAG TPA: acyl carrier protein [Conexibacter sp.]|nr:acyl carrier protein [Conexibacter sp.]